MVCAFINFLNTNVMRVKFVNVPDGFSENPRLFPNRETSLKHKKSPKPKLWYAIFFLTLLAISYVVYTPEGEPKLQPEREKERDSAVAEILRRQHNCVQYALIVRVFGYFPVLKHGEIVATDSIWLNIGEVWRYGKTCKGRDNRYPGGIYYSDGKWFLTEEHLEFFPQFKGGEVECLAEETRMIYNYPLLPECLRRKRELLIPAGNKNTN